MSEPTTLDELFNTAAKAYNVQQARKVANKHKAVKAPEHEKGHVEPKLIYTDEANWRLGRGVAVIHAASQTLLGNFQEWLHLYEEGTRKLVRSSSPLKIDVTEQVESDVFWTPPTIEHSQRLAECFITANVELECPSVAAMQVYLKVTALTEDFDAIVAVRTTDTTILAGGDTILQIKTGVNILPVLTKQSKIALKGALG